MEEVVHERLVNWANWAVQQVLPDQPQCKSMESKYVPEAGETWEDSEPEVVIDEIDAQEMENLIINLPPTLRLVIKLRYISFPYFTMATVSRKARMSVEQFERSLKDAKRKLSRAKK